MLAPRYFHLAHVLADCDQNVNAMAVTSRALAANIRMATASGRRSSVGMTGNPPADTGKLTVYRIVPWGLGRLRCSPRSFQQGKLPPGYTYGDTDAVCVDSKDSARNARSTRRIRRAGRAGAEAHPPFDHRPSALERCVSSSNFHDQIVDEYLP